MAALCAYLQAGQSVEEAAEVAILAGTLQFHRKGIQPICKKEIEDILGKTYFAKKWELYESKGEGGDCHGGQ